MIMNMKRILSIVMLILIALLYIATLILAFADSPFARQCLMAALFCTIVLPVVFYAFQLVTKQIEDRSKKDEKGALTAIATARSPRKDIKKDSADTSDS